MDGFVCDNPDMECGILDPSRQHEKPYIRIRVELTRAKLLKIKSPDGLSTFFESKGLILSQIKSMRYGVTADGLIYWWEAEMLPPPQEDIHEQHTLED